MSFGYSVKGRGTLPYAFIYPVYMEKTYLYAHFLGHHFTVKQIDDTVRKPGIVR
ncbi:hypothetical protein Runsl_1971 [Runella slithyformis DSM 19594]|uniref:Uncharacterized protein n=1 Tax=Runella slithyformis (strain ATCC 29530 / DSM 19594 / LMG 11500 / NCIMB 11436 / LSU 4) TaxID=761193 RepID=A0A7U4E5Q9_RUNSL|nr:hypothetical protein Runsl_1971 [Runella slithyformis DSM 19594]